MSVTLDVYFARMLKNGQAIFQHNAHDTLTDIASNVLGVDLRQLEVLGTDAPKLCFDNTTIKVKARPNAALHIGTRCRVIIKLSKYTLVSTFEKNEGQHITGVSASLIKINEL